MAIDIGSSTCKAVVFSASGEILSQHSACYVPEFPQPSFAEMDPDKFWFAVCECSRMVSKNLVDPVGTLCLSSHGETFVTIDSAGRPLANAILNQDSRATQESQFCERTLGREALFQITGLCSHPMYPVPKILWLRKHKPQIFRSTTVFVSLVGYLMVKMGFSPCVDYSLASRFLAFDLRKRQWSAEILRELGIDQTWLPDPLPAGTVVGKLACESASMLGLRPGTAVVLGGHDQPCGALGAGVIGGGRVADSIGTYECLLVASDFPSLNSEAFRASLNCQCHVVQDKFVTLAYFPSGLMVKWFHDLLYATASDDIIAGGLAQEFELDHYSFLESRAPEGPTGLCITPHLIGTCNPEFNPRARAIIAGLRPGTDRMHIYKGIIEGLACELSIITEALRSAVGQFRDIYVTGGGSRSVLGLKLRAAFTGCRVHVMRRQQAVCLGTAMLAGIATGEYVDVHQAIDALVDESAVMTPDEGLRATYHDQLLEYRRWRKASVERP